MMTIGKKTIAKNVIDYFEKDNYYLKDGGIASSYWTGKGADILRLSGHVDAHNFEKLLKGQFGKEQLGRMVKGELKHVPGWDCVLSQPKSFSLRLLADGDEKLKEIHTKAVNLTRRYIEANNAYTRLTKGGITKQVATGNLLIAAFDHNVSREHDPQIHTHLFVLNGTLSENGWRSIESKRIMKEQQYIGLVHRNFTAKLLIDAGYPLAFKPNGFFELEGYSQEELDLFSKRGFQIRAYIKDNNLPNNTKAQQLARLASRKQKEHIPMDELQARWQREREEHGFTHRTNIKALISNTKAANYVSCLKSENLKYKAKTTTRQAVWDAVEELSVMNMAFSENAISEQLMLSEFGQHNILTINQNVKKLITEKKLIKVDMDYYDGVEKYTTKNNIKIEKKIIKYPILTNGEFEPITNKESILESLNGSILDRQQRSAVYDICRSKDGVYILRGLAGTGKTATLNPIKNILLDNHYNITAIAPTHKAKDLMSHELGFRAQTLDYFLTKKDVASDKFTQKEMWIIDEGSFTSAKHMLALFEYAKEIKKKVGQAPRILIIGDDKQLLSIEAGHVLKQLLDSGVSRSMLSKHYRQINQEIENTVKQTYQAIDDQEFKSVIDNLDIKSLGSNEDQLNEMIKDWSELSDSDRRDSLLITPTNDKRNEVNKHVREVLTEKGVLTGQPLTTLILEDQNFQPYMQKNVNYYEHGQIIRFNKKCDVIGAEVKAFEFFKIVNVNRTTEKLTLESAKDERQITINPKNPQLGMFKDNAITVYKESELQINTGDRLRYRDKHNSLGFSKLDVLEVVNIDDGKIIVKDVKDKLHTVDPNKFDHRHYVYDYATTVHGAQGDKAKYVFALLDSKHVNTVNQRSVLVAFSRATHGLYSYTDDAEKLIEGLNIRPADNTTALTIEALSEFTNDLKKSIKNQRL